MDDAQQLCPSCGTDYVSAVIEDITAGTSGDADLLLDNLEEGLSAIDGAPLPTMGDTLRRLLPGLYGCGLLFCLVAGLLTGGNIFYLLAAVFLVALVPPLVARARHRRPMGRGEVIVCAAAKVFEEDAAGITEKFAGEGDVEERIVSMRSRIEEAMARQRAAHLRNGRLIWIAACVFILLAGAGVGALAVRNRAARKAEAEYARLPEWVKMRDNYLSTYDNDETGDDTLRKEVIRAMLDAGAAGDAEEFFFSHCEGYMGDADCAMMIVESYRRSGDTGAIGPFTSKVSLRYDSDTRKIRSIKE